ncbi:non-ribosomal peptide synthetase [Micromonospora lupini]|uniref:non-ribosomal peptide synthetase n=1 Tax=Micromonospora lupini TaxID=285679 RepID=UPI0033F6FB6D
MTGLPVGTGHGLDAGAEALWLLQQLVPNRGVSNVAMAIEFDHAPRWWPLQEALHWLVERHPALRASFPAVNQQPVRRQHAAGEALLELDVRGSSVETIEDDLTAYAAAPFDLIRAPLMRVGLFAVSPRRQVVCLVAHHIVIDAASLRILVDELGLVYDALAAGGEAPNLPPPAAPPVAAASHESVRFWRGHLAGHDAAGMRLDGARDATYEPTFAGLTVERALSDQAVQALTTLRRRCRATDAIVLLSAYYLTLYGHGAASDMLVGVMMDDRGGSASGAVGYHVATLPLRVKLTEDLPFDALVSSVTRLMLDPLEHGRVPFEVLARDDVSQSGGDWTWWRNRMVRCLFNFRPDIRDSGPVGAGSRTREVPTGLSRFDLELSVARIGPATVTGLLISTETYDADLAQAFLERLDAVLVQAGADPTRPVGEFDLRTDGDRRLVCKANRTAVSWPGSGTVLELVAAAAERSPSAIAIVDGPETVSYAQLLGTAAATRDELVRHSVGPGAVVGIVAPRGSGVAAAVLGVWAAGAAYVPLDPDHPAERLAHQLDDASCELVIGTDVPEACRTGRMVLPMPDCTTANGHAGLAISPPKPTDPAYLIYTSGSTGRPKGVVLSHGNLANLVRHFVQQLGADGADSMLWLTTFAFDISALELFLPLTVGGRVVVAADELRADPEQLLDLVERADVSVVQATPTTWRLVAPAAVERLTGRTALCGGEPLPAPLAEELRATGARLLNVYGPTETTIWSTAAELRPGSPLTVGVPIANTRVLVLDARCRERPVGLSGELCIGGDGVAVGYHRRPELTAERFVTDPQRGRYYRTGDLARWRHDGTLELLGRADRQVKLRAHRIELGEVESVLEEYPEVRAAGVGLRGDPTSDGRLVAFVAATDRPGLSADVWAHAARRLPSYALPAQIVALAALPTTGNGKTDHRALAALAVPEAVDDPVASPGQARVATADEREATLVQLWRLVLGRPTIGPRDNLFLNGGNSLTAVRLAAQATDRCGVPVTMAMVFRAPSPAGLARLIRAGEGGGDR